MIERTRDLLGCDLFEGAAQVRQMRSEGAGGQFSAQVREALIDRRAHRRQAHQLLQPPALGGLDEIVHADARHPGTLRGARIDVRRHAEIDEERRRALLQPHEHRLFQSGSPPPAASTSAASAGGELRNASSDCASPPTLAASSAAVAAVRLTMRSGTAACDKRCAQRRVMGETPMRATRDFAPARCVSTRSAAKSPSEGARRPRTGAARAAPW